MSLEELHAEMVELAQSGAIAGGGMDSHTHGTVKLLDGRLFDLGFDGEALTVEGRPAASLADAIKEAG